MQEGSPKLEALQKELKLPSVGTSSPCSPWSLAVLAPVHVSSVGWRAKEKYTK